MTSSILVDLGWSNLGLHNKEKGKNFIIKEDLGDLAHLVQTLHELIKPCPYGLSLDIYTFEY